jgi:dihydropteroate synthase
MLDYSAPLPGLNTGVPLLATAAGKEDFSSTSSAAVEEDVVGVVATELAARLKDIDRHIPRWLQLIDPGIGFAKRAEQSAELMRPESLRRLRQALGGREMAMGCSRKRVLTHLWRNSDSNGGAAVGELGTGTTCNGSGRNVVARGRDPTLEERDMLTAAAGCAAFLGGAKILRVHNVHYTKSVCDVFAALVDEHK